jgi:hypothetical protein
MFYMYFTPEPNGVLLLAVGLGLLAMALFAQFVRGRRAICRATTDANRATARLRFRTMFWMLVVDVLVTLGLWICGMTGLMVVTPGSAILPWVVAATAVLTLVVFVMTLTWGGWFVFRIVPALILLAAFLALAAAFCYYQGSYLYTMHGANSIFWTMYDGLSWACNMLSWVLVPAVAIAVVVEIIVWIVRRISRAVRRRATAPTTP